MKNSEQVHICMARWAFQRRKKKTSVPFIASYMIDWNDHDSGSYNQQKELANLL